MSFSSQVQHGSVCCKLALSRISEINRIISFGDGFWNLENVLMKYCISNAAFVWMCIGIHLACLVIDWLSNECYQVGNSLKLRHNDVTEPMDQRLHVVCYSLNYNSIQLEAV